VQYRTSLNDPAWQVWTGGAVVMGERLFIVDLGGESKFFRISAGPPHW
jgi:hypothetical protein